MKNVKIFVGKKKRVKHGGVKRKMILALKSVIIVFLEN